jgi:hypothetical protein
MDMIQQQLDDGTVSRISEELGADPNTTRQAVPAALSALLGGLSRNAQQPDGAQQLDSALDAHGGGGGGLLGSLGSIVGGALGADGSGILGHIFGQHQPAVASQVGQRTGLDQGQAARLLMLLAPIVLAYLARARGQQPASPGAGAADGGGESGGGAIGSITDILNGERAHVEQAHPEHKGILDSILDRNHDGHILDDVAGMAGGLLRGGGL